VKTRTLIVDDEPHAREGIRIRLKEFKNIQIVGECSSGIEAVRSINSLNPDLLFLDIQMPEMNGFEVLKKITVTPLPVILFVTAFDKYAIKAFECHAVDYLLKPIREDRFKNALQAALSEISHRNLAIYANKLKSVVNDYFDFTEENPEYHHVPDDKKKYLDRLMIKSKENVSVIPIHEIEWIESAGDYVYVHSSSQKFIFRETLTALAERMDPQKFIRIHRSTIVNVEKIKTLRLNEHSDFDVYLLSGVKLKLSRTYRSHFEQVTGNPL
jgi:two-component system, LytTR family, response regulator